MNLLMKIDRWIGGILIISGVLSYFLNWFSDKASITFGVVGLILVFLSLTADKGKTTKK